MRTLAAALLTFALAAPAFADGYHYTPGLHADPFRAPELTQPQATCEGGALCNVDVADLRVTGIVTGRAKPLAMVEDGKGGAFILHRGDLVGRGRVEDIRSDRVVVVEVHMSASGPVKVARELKLN